MSNDTIITWHENDLRSEGQDDPAFYTWGLGHTPICTVHHNGRSVVVACDGEMRLHDNKRDEIARYSDDLPSFSILTDSDIEATYEDDRFTWVNNTWFDLYDANDDSDGHLDCVCHSLTDAIEQAVVLCAEGIPSPDEDAE